MTHGLCCVECHASGTAQGENTGAAVERERIIKLLENRLEKAKATAASNGLVSAMRRPVSIETLEAVIEAMIYAIKGENK